MSSSIRSAHARVAALIRHHGADSPAVTQARAELAEQTATRRRIVRAVASLPPAELDRLRAVLDEDGEGAA